jgi:tight adherence protein B
MMLVLATLCSLGVVLWPHRDPVLATELSRERPTGEPGGRGDDEVTGGLRERARRLWSTEVRFGPAETAWVADFAELAAVGLDAGLPGVDAARLACAVGAGASVQMREVGELIAATEADGGQVGDALRHAAGDHGDLAFLAAAWRLSEEFGVASAPAARLTAQVLRERSASVERRTVLAAGPRASMWLLTLLPLSGPLVAVLLGLPVAEVYGDGAAGLTAVVGLGATALGWVWSRRLLGRALRPAVVP